MHRLFYGSFLIIIALASAISIGTSRVFSWFNLGVVTILLAKGFFWARSRSMAPDNYEQYKNNFIILAAGYFITAVLFVLSGFLGEGWFGFLAAPVFATTAIAMTFVIRTANKQHSAVKRLNDMERDHPTRRC
ncbi:hypothetical protein JXQ70_19935 [bacterium]|nr:hypothetical protein [bacterium]